MVMAKSLETSMRLSRKLLSLTLLCAITFTAVAKTTPWFNINDNKEVKLRVALFLSTTCPHCKKMNQFFTLLTLSNPWLQVDRYWINQNKADLKTYRDYLGQEKLEDFAVPAAYFCNTRWLGFSTAEKSGTHLLQGLAFCRQQIAKEGGLSKATEQQLRQQANTSWYGEYMTTKLKAPLFTPFMALLEFVNVTSLFITISLFALLRLETSARRRFWMGVLFLVGISLPPFIPTEVLRVMAVLTGLGLLMARWLKRPAWLLLLWAPLTGWVIKGYQQGHLPNFSLIYHSWLKEQGLLSSQQLLYLSYYQTLYLALIILFTLILLRIKQGSKVKEFSWHYLAIIGLLLICYPYGLTMAWFAAVSVVLGLVLTWLRSIK